MLSLDARRFVLPVDVFITGHIYSARDADTFGELMNLIIDECRKEFGMQ
jgi:hypothetical protein